MVIWYIYGHFGIFYGHLVYFMVIWYMLLRCGMLATVPVHLVERFEDSKVVGAPVVKVDLQKWNSILGGFGVRPRERRQLGFAKSQS
jgi:hypothetical protein